jgi:uncharacterized membrane protein YhaH (DUF805 family)
LKVSAQFSFWGGIVFAIACGAYGLYGLSTTAEAGLTEAQHSERLGFALFWMFLAAIGAVMAFVSRLMIQGRLGALDD